MFAAMGRSYKIIRGQGAIQQKPKNIRAHGALLQGPGAQVFLDQVTETGVVGLDVGGPVMQ